MSRSLNGDFGIAFVRAHHDDRGAPLRRPQREHNPSTRK